MGDFVRRFEDWVGGYAPAWGGGAKTSPSAPQGAGHGSPGVGGPIQTIHAFSDEFDLDWDTVNIP